MQRRAFMKRVLRGSSFPAALRVRGAPTRFAAIRLLLAASAIAFGAFLLSFERTPDAAAQSASQSNSPVVRVIELDSTIDIVSARFLKRAISSANDDAVEVVVIELDTPGGTLDSTRDMVTTILESEVPVVVFVSPEGAQAASAGTFISAAAGLLAMAPATNIGAASPVDGSGNDLPDTLESKVKQDTAAFMRSIADERGRNTSALEATVTDAIAYSANEAVELNVADLIARHIDDLLVQIDGRSIPTFESSVTVNTSGARIERRGMPFVDRVIAFLANPNVALLFISLGTIALIVELWNPGLLIPGTLGVALLVLGWVGVGNLDFSWAGVIFLALAILLFILESQAPGVSYFGIAGSIALVIGGFFLVGRFTDPDLPGGVQTVSIWLLVVLGTVILSFILWLSWQIRQAAKSPDWTSAGASEGIVGQEALVTMDLDPEGEVHVGGEYWSAELVGAEFTATGRTVRKDEKVRVVRVDGVHLFVEPLRRGISHRDEGESPVNV